MLLPSISIKDIEEMPLKEIERRISFVRKTKSEQKKSDVRNYISLAHLAISAGNNPSKKNNKIFYSQLDKIFGKEIQESEEMSLEDVMNIVNVKK